MGTSSISSFHAFNVLGKKEQHIMIPKQHPHEAANRGKHGKPSAIFPGGQVARAAWLQMLEIHNRSSDSNSSALPCHPATITRSVFSYSDPLNPLTHPQSCRSSPRTPALNLASSGRASKSCTAPKALKPFDRKCA